MTLMNIKCTGTNKQNLIVIQCVSYKILQFQILEHISHANTNNVETIDDANAKTLKELGPEIVSDIEQRDRSTSSGDKILKKKGIDAKPEIVTDRRHLHYNLTSINDVN